MTQENKNTQRQEVKEFKVLGEVIRIASQDTEDTPLAVEFYDKPIDWNNGGS